MLALVVLRVSLHSFTSYKREIIWQEEIGIYISENLRDHQGFQQLTCHI